MKIPYRNILSISSSAMMLGVSFSGFAEQWSGKDNTHKKIWRSGPVVIGETPRVRVEDTDAMLELSRPIAASGIPLLSAKAVYQGNVSTVFQVDTKGVYVGGASLWREILRLNQWFLLLNDQPMFDCQADKFDRGVDVELLSDIGLIVGDCFKSDIECSGDILYRLTLCQESKHLKLSRG